MGENMAETIDELSAALGELESGQGLSSFTGGQWACNLLCANV